LYKGTPQWVPPFYQDIELMLNKKKHPFYELNDADFFVARRDGKIVGRIAAMENRSFNDYHKTTKAQFYLFDLIDDLEVAKALFEKVFDWCRQRKLNELVGPKGFSAFDGYGILIEGYEHRQMMTMMNYNFPYYKVLMEKLGFEKEVDFVSCYLKSSNFNLPEKVKEVARRVEERGVFGVKNFKSKAELTQWADRIGKAYNDTFINNWEYYPLTKGEVKLLLDNLLIIAVPSLIKIITHNDDIIGFLLGFPDISAALQRNGGKNPLLRPWHLLDIFRELKKTDFISLNGAGVLPEFQGRGGNALLYAEMEKTIKSMHFKDGELTQVAETAVQMRKDLITAGGQAYKNHRIFHKKF
jgi:GNAT superfamily N-acetyltransferase